MGYAAIVYLKQLVEEEFIQFLCKTLEFEEFKVSDFHFKVNNVLSELRASTSTSPSSLPVKIQDYFHHLAPKVVDVDTTGGGAFLFNKVWLNDRAILNRVHLVMHQLDGVHSILDNFMESQGMIHSLAVHSSETLALQGRVEFADRLISMTYEFQGVVSLLTATAKEAISLHDVLGPLLLKVQNANDDSWVNQIQVILGNIGDKIEDLLTDYPFSMRRIKIEGLTEIKNAMDDLREVVDRLELSTLENFPSGGEPLSKPGSSQEKQAWGWLNKWQHLFFIQPQYKEGDTGLRNLQLNSFPETEHMQSLELDKVPGKVSNVLSQSEGSSSSSVKREDTVVGLDGDITKIIDELTNNELARSIVTIAGMGGIGKTTLARKVYDHTTVAYRFDLTAWVSGKSSTNEMLSSLLHSIVMASNELKKWKSEEEIKLFPDEIHGKSTEDKAEKLRKLLKGKRYLIVVDDLWNFDAWNAIEACLPDDHLGSRILVTSRSKEFLTHLPRIYLHCMRLLSKNQSWDMLERLVFGEVSCPFELVDIGKAMARKCGGLRLTIAVVAGILLSIPRSYISWSSFLDNLNSIVYDDPESCLDVISLSYNYLPHHLKTCFLLMGSFPATSEIDTQKLFNIWVAEGYLDYKSSHYPEKVAERYLEELVCRCLVFVGKRSFDGKIRTCYLHELLHQSCLLKGQEELFKRRHLVSSSSKAEDMYLYKRSDLRSMVILSPNYDISLDDLFFQLSTCKSLRVVDMYFLPLDSFPSKVLDLVNLRYLALNITYVLDARISRFWKLQTLVVYGPWIPRVGGQSKYIPTLYLDCWKMPWLRNVCVRVPSYLSLSDDYPVTSGLQTLSAITFSSCTQAVFSLIPKLHKLGIYETKEDCVKAEYTRCLENLQSMTQLEVLKCSFYKTEKSLDYDIPARYLVLDHLPLNLKKLTLCGSCLPWHEFQVLSLLTKLETLKLKDYAFKGQWWQLGEAVFGCLKQLLIDESDLETWEDESIDNFPRLTRLELRSCRSLQQIPFHAFSDLELIGLHNCSQSAEDSAKEFREQFSNDLTIVATNRRAVAERGGQSTESGEDSDIEQSYLGLNKT